MRLTVGIKALNEEKNIAACIESALAVARQYEAEVVLADSGSMDRTIAIASGYPIRIVRLGNPSERCCGAGAQLAFQHAKGDFFCLVDGDMLLSAEFVDAGLKFLAAHESCAGVGGYVRERNLDNADFQIRAQSLAADRNRIPGFVDRLEGGGLYRTSAVQETGYFADRNLHAFEEFELAVRLCSRGWKLARIDEHAVDHFGYRMAGYRLLWHRTRSGYATGVGEVMRATWSNGHFLHVLKNLEHVKFSFAVVVWWFLVCGALTMVPWTALALLAVPIIYLSVRRRSARLGMYCFLTWNIIAAGMIRGLLRRRIPPTVPLAAVELQPDAKGWPARAREFAASGATTVVPEGSPCAF